MVRQLRHHYDSSPWHTGWLCGLVWHGVVWCDVVWRGVLWRVMRWEMGDGIGTAAPTPNTG